MEEQLRQQEKELADDVNNLNKKVDHICFLHERGCNHRSVLFDCSQNSLRNSLTMLKLNFAISYVPPSPTIFYLH